MKISQAKSFIDHVSIVTLVIIVLTFSLSFVFSNDRIRFIQPTEFSTSQQVFPFTFARVGYPNTIPYFNSNSNSEVFSYEFLEEFDGIFEPSTFMSITTKDSNFSLDNQWSFTICLKSNMSSCILQSEQFSASSKVAFFVDCIPFEQYSIEVAEKNHIGGLVSKLTGSAVCIYVRREIQDLTPEDFSALMSAMHTLWTTSEEQGRLEYGQSFHNSTYFAQAHDFNAAWSDSDHIHEGLGFLPQHIKLTNMFEKAIQAVDPSVTLPYWDSTLEVEQGKAINQSVLFSEQAFGSLIMPARPSWGFTYEADGILSGRIPDGRWKEIRAESNVYPQLSNAYGYMRGPWNTNPSPYISRFPTLDSNLPSCSGTVTFLDENRDLSSFLYQSSFAPHAATHGSIGSVFGCDLLSPMLTKGLIADESYLLSLCKVWSFQMKELYRAQLILPNQNNCDSSDQMELSETLCPFNCSQTSDALLSGVKGHLEKYVGVDLSDEQWGEWKTFICEGEGYRIFFGDHLESASPADPSFWPIHPTIERLLQARLMTGGFEGSEGEDWDWPDDSSESYVCDKAECYEDGVKTYHPQCCRGHYEDDQMLDFINGNSSAMIGSTNKEVLTATDPRSPSYSMPYIYAHFEWTHCPSSSDPRSTLLQQLASLDQDLETEEEEEEEEEEEDEEENNFDQSESPKHHSKDKHKKKKERTQNH